MEDDSGWSEAGWAEPSKLVGAEFRSLIDSSHGKAGAEHLPPSKLSLELKDDALKVPAAPTNQ